MKKNALSKTMALCAIGIASQQSFADTNSELASQLTNPVANLISFPLQGNYNTHLNTQSSGHQTYVNVQPVIPINLSPEWLVISRTIVPVMDVTNPIPYAGERFGLSDTLQSFFFSPHKPEAGIIWGLGPALQIPTGTQQLLGSGKWAAGPTAVILKMVKGWTVGALASHLWSFAGSDGRNSLNQTFVQPFVAYTTKSAWSYTFDTETTYYWNAGDVSMPFNFIVSKTLTIGKQPISLGGGIRYWAGYPDTGPRDFGYRFVVTFIFPEGKSTQKDPQRLAPKAFN